MSSQHVDLVLRRHRLAEQAAAIEAETAVIDRRLRGLLAQYLTQHVSQCADDAPWRWEITGADERGVLFSCTTFFHGFDTPTDRAKFCCRSGGSVCSYPAAPTRR